MNESRVWVFFYGSYINLDVLRELGLIPERHEVARLSGFDIRIAPLANLVPSDRHVVYGVVATATHSELERLYHHAATVLGGLYRPQAVVAECLDGRLQPALCYLAENLKERPADPAYVRRISEPARTLDFPVWYIERLERYLTPGGR